MSNSEEFDKITNAYQAAVELWKLASQQIYSRFAAMLTGNSIIIAAIALAITARVDIPYVFVLALIATGFALCLVWIYFMAHGVRAENKYRRDAERIEKKVVPDGEKIAIPTGDPKYKGFFQAVTIVVYLFVAIYITLFILVSYLERANIGG